ncbi:hypothetical protein O3597_23110 [Verrucosispora sp. WMMA2044]|uniref:Uncharacterized protein n=1 Tax=Verrucosispora sioxanthis TaxID=2499994 RepID=A0A6M1L754_9ACTN|nr:MULTISPECIES: hypothetical protein [Micromonospora]NEE63493.1 hypothetical protein [Verrucosispora sioxanthis]NGM12603.1 hypothetical protein [Verrucosispora sioxanthis]WBB47976.1 hypothetical protein O3597_23110 [Verrucosispora sp. WMMA2044]
MSGQNQDGGQERWSAVVASVDLPGGREVSLQTAAGGTEQETKVGSSRCWRISEVADDGTEIATTSACHGLGTTAAARVFGVVVVASPCRTQVSVKVDHPSDLPVVRDVFDGFFLVPPALVSELDDMITFSCLDESGGAGEPMTLDVVD